MWYKRRTLVKTIMIAGAVAIPALGRWVHRSAAPKSTVKMRLVTTFPKPISPSEWSDVEKSLVSPEFYDLVQDMRDSGEIADEKMHIFTDHSIWEVDFRDIAASERWIQTINELGLVDNELCRKLGFKVESYLA